MSIFYCRKCAIELGLMKVAGMPNPTATPYQAAKFDKHTQSTASHAPISVFDDPSLNSYVGYAASASAYGCLEIDAQGRENAVWNANKRVGFTSGQGHYSVDSGVKAVLFDDPNKIHLFPTANDQLLSEHCARCLLKLL